MTDCTHHWILSMPSGNPTCYGYCKKCGAERWDFECYEGTTVKSISGLSPDVVAPKEVYTGDIFENRRRR